MKLRRRQALPMAVALLLAVVAMVAIACGGGGSGSGSSYGSGGGTGETSPTVAPSGAAGGGSSAEQERVTIESFSYSPASLAVKTGTTVVWTNKDSAPHTVTSTDGPGVDAATTGEFDSGSMSQGDTFELTFDKPGTYYYECTIHADMPSMHAEVVVE